jgi:hypothetical protein
MTSNLASLLFGDASVEEVGEAFDNDDKVTAWINANPPDVPEHQNNCAACGGYIPVHETGWVILGDGALIHYSGNHGMECWEQWQRKRREECGNFVRAVYQEDKKGD